MEVKQALTDWKTAGDNLTTLDSNLGQATSKRDEIKQELADAETGVVTATKADVDGAAQYDLATDALVAALLATKRTPPPPVEPVA